MAGGGGEGVAGAGTGSTTTTTTTTVAGHFLAEQKFERQRDNTANGNTWQTNAKNVDGLRQGQEKE